MLMLYNKIPHIDILYKSMFFYQKNKKVLLKIYTFITTTLFCLRANSFFSIIIHSLSLINVKLLFYLNYSKFDIILIIYSKINKIFKQM